MSEMVNVSLVVNVPEGGATFDQITEWIEFRCGFRCDMSADNPLESCDLDANFCEVDPH